MSDLHRGNSYDSPDTAERVVSITIIGIVSLWVGAVCGPIFFALLGTVGFFMGLGLALGGGFIFWRIVDGPVTWELLKWRFSDKKGVVMDSLRSIDDRSTLPALRSRKELSTSQKRGVLSADEQLVQELSELERIGQIGRSVTEQMSHNFLFAYIQAVSDLNLVSQIQQTQPPLPPALQQRLADQVEYHLRQLGETTAVVNQALLRELQTYYRQHNPYPYR